MANANTSRRLSWDQPVTRETLEEMVAARLPAHGSSPAIDLQRRLGEAALRGFYAPTARRSRIGAKRLLIVAGSAALSWAVVFGGGALLVG